jgi:hypothetical protein
VVSSSSYYLNQRQLCKAQSARKQKVLLLSSWLKHLLFQCKVTCSIRSTVQVASNLYLPCTVANIFGNWLHEVDQRDRIIRVRPVALLWSLWLRRNDNVFNAKNYSPMQVIFQCAYYLRSWSTLQKWNIVSCLWRCARGWSMWRMIFYPLWVAS